MKKLFVPKLILIFVIFIIPELTISQLYDRDLQKIDMTWKIISTFYVDTTNPSKLAEEAINGMLKTLDPHSIYFSKEEVQRMNEPLNGSFEGIGIHFLILHDTLMVVQTIPGGPSEKVGVQAGDRIVKVDSSNIAGTGLKNSDVYKLLKGKKGTVVNISVKRKNNRNLIQFKITRDKIPIYSIDAAYMAAPDIGYIKVNKFAGTTYDEFCDAYKKLEKYNMKDLILDLRGNGGGYMKAAIDIADEFLKKKKLIVFTEGIASPRRNYWSSSKGKFDDGRLVILIDEGTASASEIVSGAIQDWDRGVIIGRRSFGKGLVQRPFTLPDGSMIRLTTSKYFTPSGRCIQKPYDEGKDAYSMELYERYKHGEMVSEDSIKLNKSLVYKTLKNGRKVFGGGGIMPDYFIPADTSLYSDYYQQIVRNGVLNQFVTSYADVNRKDLENNYPDFDLFKTQYMVGDELLKSLISSADKENIEFNEEQFNVSKDLIKTQIKALIARDLWTSSEYFEIINPVVNTYQEAIEILQNKDTYNNLLK